MLLAFGRFFQFNNAFSKRETFLGTDLLLGYIRVQGTKRDNNNIYRSVHFGCQQSKRHFRPPQHWAFPTSPPRIGGVSPKRNLLGSGMGEKLRNVARPDSTLILDKMQKGHMKGQRKGVQSTKVLALVTIKVEPGTANPPPPTIKKHYDIFVVVHKLLDTVHTHQTGVFPITSQ
jgi:hypothetical protein